MKKITKELSIDEISQKLDQLTKKLFNRKSLRSVFVGKENLFDKVESKITDLSSHFNDKLNGNVETIPSDSKNHFVKELWLTTTPVSYAVRSFKVDNYCSEESSNLFVLANLLQSNFLHSEIREKGGAYGAMASYSSDEGIFSFLSYRDPNLGKTYQVYDQAVDWLLSGKFNQTDVQEAILQACSKMDTPLSPAAKAIADYSSDRKGKTLEMRNLFRKRVLSLNKDALIETGKKFLLNKGYSDVAVTSEAIKEKEEVKYDFKHFEINKI